MSEKATVVAAVLKVKHVTVSADNSISAAIGFELEGGHDLELHLAPEIMAVLEAMIMAASTEQAKHQPIQ
ncbi:hypothetical protein [Bosea sp. PAMC 26642]|uniref:hypothetical protein n=1 Tax=Bosea sp. (strain PAMC 26642) TaxID=1792307 RepID=UPI0007704BED|nr:hypothetical protein [Bosea sp. PAMC 26642]AMJ59354.1 hypothetical protein AXW83_02690 [Bosea sp. PAMC 26642]